jgi:hypothetical protein
MEERRSGRRLRSMLRSPSTKAAYRARRTRSTGIRSLVTLERCRASASTVPSGEQPTRLVEPGDEHLLVRELRPIFRGEDLVGQAIKRIPSDRLVLLGAAVEEQQVDPVPRVAHPQPARATDEGKVAAELEEKVLETEDEPLTARNRGPAATRRLRDDELTWRSIDELVTVVRRFIDPVLVGGSGTWVPESWAWRAS